MTKKITLLFILLAAISSVSAQQQQTKQDEIIKVETALVSVPVTVSDRQNRYVPNLTAQDFSVFQDGARQKIEFFAATEEPITVAVLIDTSRSTERVLGDIKDAARSFIKQLLPDDRATIISFDYDTHVLSALTSDREQLKRAVNSAEIGERPGTVLNDALFETVNRTFAKIKGRKAIILLTDGKDAGSDVADEELLRSLEESDALVYPILFETQGNFGAFNRRGGGVFGGGGGMGRRGGVFGGRFPRPENPRRRERVERKNAEARELMQQIADETAGRLTNGESGNLKKTFASIAEELRRQYRLGFYPNGEGNNQTLHEIKVTVSRPDAIVRARRSYRVRPQNDSKD